MLCAHQSQRNNISPRNFIDTDDTDVFYDAFCELLPDTFKKCVKQFEPFDFEVDLYGTKPLAKIKSRYILTGRLSFNPLFQYSLSIKPHELNVLYGVSGDDISFARTSTISKRKYRTSEIRRNSYYYNIPSFLLKSKDAGRVVERSSGGCRAGTQGGVLRRAARSAKNVFYDVLRKTFPPESRRRHFLFALLNRLGR